MAQGTEVFREKTIDRLSSPDELTDYLKVTNPRMWAILIAVVVFLLGLIAWACVGTLPTKVAAKIVVRNGSATVHTQEATEIDDGMRVTLKDSGGNTEEFTLESVSEGANGETVGFASVSLSDGTYNGTVVTDEIRAIDFLLKSN